MTVFRYVGAAALVLAVAPAAAAAASDPTCGATITSDVRLRADLVDCPGDGLVIGADGVTVDLGRSTVDGVGAGAGIRLSGHRGVKIKGGSVKEFASGLVLDGADGNRVSGLRVRASTGRGIDVLGGSDGNVFEGVAASGNRTGLAVTESASNTVRLSSLSENAVTGVLVFGGARNRITTNRIVGNAGNGVALVEGSTENVVAANDIRGAVTSVVVDTSDRNAIAINRVSGGGDGMQIAGDANTVTGNFVDRAVGGCEGCTGYGIGVLAGTGNVLKANVVTRSSSDGISVAVPGTVLAFNVALRNAALGINAVSGVRDAGGNRASGNGNAAQCAGVSCSNGKKRRR